MSLNQLLTKKKTTITKQWFDLVARTYPPDTQQFLKSQKDPFANPVGQTTLKGLQSLFDEILKGVDKESEFGADFFVGHLEKFENLLLDIALMDTNTARCSLNPIHNEVVRRRTHLKRISIEQM